MRLAAKVFTTMAAVTVGIAGFAAPSTASSLTVSGFCDSGHGSDPYRDFWCYAWPSGGTGSYTVTWRSLSPSTAFLDAVDGPAISGYCHVHSSNTVRVTVTSGGESAVREFQFNCRYDPY